MILLLAACALSPQFPTADTPPTDGVNAQLSALRSRDLPQVYHLFSRARRAIFAEQGRAQGSGAAPPPAVLHRRMESALPAGLLNHESSTILSALSLNERENGRLPRFACRVRCDGRNFVFTLQRQHDPPPPEREAALARRDSSCGVTMAHDARNAGRFDGYDGCWFVWSIAADGGGDGDAVGGGPPEAARPLAGVR